MSFSLEEFANIEGENYTNYRSKKTGGGFLYATTRF